MPRESTETTPVAPSPDALLRIALSKLPFHAEEDNCRETLAESELLAAITISGAGEDAAITLIHILRRQLEALSLLDPVELRKGNWAFTSFPASLLGRAWITTLATQGQTLLQSDYWEQGDHRPDEFKEEQRALLHRIETNRLQLNDKAPPIRVVHVAWALIRWGGNFLLHRREDISRPGEKGYGLVGGRFKLSDLPPSIQSSMDILQEVFKIDSEIVARHITKALERELEEETGMLLGKHYTYEPFGKSLPPYKAVNGAGNRHAYSAYKFHLFQVKLSTAGETHLLARIAQDARKSPPKLTWFTAAEIAAPQRADGAAAYVDVLHHAWCETLEKKLLSVSGSVSPQTFTGETKMLDLPGAPDAPFLLGKPGKEKPVRSAKVLTESEWQFLMLLGWHVRGFHIEPSIGAEMQLLDNGWIDAPDLAPLARSLIGKMPPDLSGLVEIREGRFVSLRIEPDVLFFTANLFCYQILGSNSAGGMFRLKRPGLETRWGLLGAGDYEKDINGNTAITLRNL